MQTRVEEKGNIAPGGLIPIGFLDLDDTTYHGLIMADLVVAQLASGLLKKAAVPPVLEAIAEYQAGKKGHASNVAELNLRWAAACKGLSFFDLLEHTKDFIRANPNKVASFTKPVYRLLRREGYGVWLITGEPQFVGRSFDEEFKGSGFCATQWETNDRWRITGKIKKVMTSEQKAEWTKMFFDPAFKHDRTRSLALIDSINDIGLAEAVPFSIVCGNPSPGLIDYLESSGKHFVVARPNEVIKQVRRYINQHHIPTL